DEIRWDPISGKWIANELSRVRRIGTSRKRVVDLGRETALVTSQLRCGGDFQEGVIVLSVTESLVSKIEEGLVLAIVQFRNPDWPAERSAKLILPEWRDFL